MASSVIQSIDGIIVKKKPLFEHDCLLTIISKEQGMIRILAKYALSKKFRFGGYLDGFYRLDIEYKEGKSFNFLSQLSAIERYPKLRQSYAALMLGYYMAQVISQVVSTEYPCPEIYELFCETLAALDAGEPPERLRDSFHRHFLRIEGIEDSAITKADSFIPSLERYLGKTIYIPDYLRTSATKS